MVSEIQPGQTISRRPPTHPDAHPDTMGENNTPTALKGCGVKTQNQLFYDPSLTHQGGRVVKLTGYLDSPHMVSYYLPVHFIALNAILKKIVGGLA